MNDLIIITNASLVAMSCSLLGCFLILRQMAMLADAISHAVLPGIVIAYLFSGSRESIWLLPGAALSGVLATYLIEAIHRKARIHADASIGVVFTWMFALGVVLISLFAGQTDLDQDCVLYGEIAYTPLDLWITNSGFNLGPRQIWLLSILFLAVFFFVKLGMKGLSITAFDASFAAITGVNVIAWHYALMGMVSITTVFSFESVGAILVVAMFTAPPATAYLLTDKLKTMILLSILFAITSSISGYYLAWHFNSSVSGAIAVAAGIQFSFAFALSLHKKNILNRKQAKQI